MNEEVEYNQKLSEIMNEKIESRGKMFTTLLMTFSAILAVNCTYGMSNPDIGCFALLGIKVFPLLLCSNMIWLLSTLTLLYEKIDACNQILHTMMAHKQIMCTYSGGKVVESKRRTLFVLCELLSYACFVLTVSSLVIFSFIN